jgi:type 2 lantibiotic biosynthesis protein LanM
MRLSPETLAEIAANASTLEERITDPNLVPSTVPSPRLVEARLNAWAERAAKGDRGKLSEFVALRGWDLDKVAGILGEVKLADPQKLPDWALLLEEFVASFSHLASESAPLLDPAAPMPFEQIWAPFVREAVSKLQLQAPAGWELLREPARIVLERQLLFWLCNGSAEIMVQEFSIFRNAWRRPPEPVADEKAALAAYYQHLEAGGLIELFRQYSALARAVALAIEHWIEASAEFLSRLSTDYPELRKFFADDTDPGKVADLKAGLSDPHRRGRTVAALKFDSELKIVYKPKDLGAEHAWSQIMEWVNRQNPGLKLRAMKALLRRTYGWIEYISHKTCSGDAEMERFYYRGGMLLAIFRVLGSTDIHYENLIANGEFPIPVDSETMITPLLWNSESLVEESADLKLLKAFDDSVLRSSMLPVWRPFQEVNTDISGLGCVGGEEISVPIWENSHSDSLHSANVRVQADRPSNTPFAEGDAFPARYMEHVVNGFREMYTLLRTHRDEFESEGGPLEKLAASPMRIVFRETYIYFRLLKRSLEPKFMHYGIDRSIDLEALCRILFTPATRPAFLPMVLAEKTSLQNLDIPFFTMHPDQRDMYGESERIVENYFLKAPIESVRTNLAHMSEADLNFQIAVIRHSFFCKALNQRSPIEAPSQAPDGPPASLDEFMDAARAIARRIDSSSVRGGSETAAFFGLQVHPADGLYRLGPLALRLFDGATGVVLFLSALHKTAGDSNSEELCNRLLRTIKLFVEQTRTRNSWNRAYNTDVEAGLLIYPLLKMGEIRSDSTVIELATEIAGLITPPMLSSDFPYDIYGGCAGILTGLMALHEKNPSDRILEKAILCGRKLNSRSGVLHPGISLALARLRQVSGDRTFSPVALAPWCRNEAGRGIAALAAADRPENAEILERTLNSTLAEPLEASDSIYSGSFGRVSFWSDASRMLERPDLKVAAIRLATESIRRANRDGGFRVYPGLPPAAWGPGFFEGISGIGYEILRLSDPELPSVTLWK